MPKSSGKNSGKRHWVPSPAVQRLIKARQKVLANRLAASQALKAARQAEAAVEQAAQDTRKRLSRRHRGTFDDLSLVLPAGFGKTSSLIRNRSVRRDRDGNEVPFRPRNRE